MSSRKKFFLIFLFIIFDMFLVIGFLVVRDATMLNDLKKEVHELSKLDITKDRYNRKIQSRGNYAIVEGAIKDYLDDYAILLQDVLQVIKDPQLTKILSYENFEKDGPDFNASKEYLVNTKNDFDDKIEVLLKKLEEDTISKYIDDKISDPYYQDLYRELMLSNNMRDDFQETKDLLLKTQSRVDSVLNTSYEILNYLANNKKEWKLEDGEIKFEKQAIYDTYIKKVSKLNSNADNKKDQ